MHSCVRVHVSNAMENFEQHRSTNLPECLDQSRHMMHAVLQPKIWQMLHRMVKPQKKGPKPPQEWED